MKVEILLALLLLGWLVGWTLKYIIVGLEAWNNYFHPELVPCMLGGPYAKFAKPFLGAFENAP